MKREYHQVSAYECCGICGEGAEEEEEEEEEEESRCLLHNLRHRGAYRRLCTNCVLKNSAGSFCPICLQVYEEGKVPATHVRLMCLKCPSVAHSSCVPSQPHRFTCPSCSDPNFTFFTFKYPNDHMDCQDPNTKKKKKKKTTTTTTTTTNNNNSKNNSNSHPDVQRFIDQGSARALVAAAKLAVVSMTKAAMTARFEAERRVREAISAKKRAREALERLLYLAAKEKENEIKDNSNSRKPLVGVKGSATATATATATAAPFKPPSKSKVGAHAINSKKEKPANGSNGLCSASLTTNNAGKLQGGNGN